MNSFELKIFKELNKINIEKNLVISSISIYHILSLTTNGALNKTLEEMLNVLSHKNLDEMNKNNKLISSIISKFKSIEFANAIFSKFKPETLFMNKIKEYKATMDILKDEAQINKWCNDKTHKKIPKIIDKLTDNDVMVLINAIYFNGTWEKSFDPKKSNKNCFMNNNKTSININFMNMTDNFDYFENEQIQAISLNYNKDNMKALIILPKTEKEKDINNFVNNFSEEEYINIIKNLQNKKVILKLPKFELNFEAELKDTLISLGMVEAFSDNADFSSMTKKNNVKIGRIIHKTFISIDEKGTKAAAATAIVMKTLCFIPNNDPIMNVNHPFLFIVRNENLPKGFDMIFASKVEVLK